VKIRILPFDGKYLRVTDDKDDEFYTVELTWPKGKSLPDKGKLRKKWVSSGEVLLLSSEKITPNVPRIAAGDQAQKDEYLSKIAKKVQEAVGMRMEEVLSFLKDLDSLQCMLSAEANADIGMKVFGAGLGLEFALKLKKEDRMYKLGQVVYYQGKEVSKRFFHDIACKDNRRTGSSTLSSEMDLDPAKNSSLIEDCLMTSKGLSSFQGWMLPNA
jgi:hypothetical protein